MQEFLATEVLPACCMAMMPLTCRGCMSFSRLLPTQPQHVFELFVCGDEQCADLLQEYKPLVAEALHWWAGGGITADLLNRSVDQACPSCNPIGICRLFHAGVLHFCL